MSLVLSSAFSLSGISTVMASNDSFSTLPVGESVVSDSQKSSAITTPQDYIAYLKDLKMNTLKQRSINSIDTQDVDNTLRQFTSLDKDSQKNL